MKLFNRVKKYQDLSPDEIFLDAKNISRMDHDAFEGHIEKPLAQKNILIIGICICVASGIGMYKLFSLQVVHGNAYALQSERNRLISTPLFGDRGVIYDRNGIALVRNNGSTTPTEIAKREYVSFKGLAPVLGFVSYPKKDSSGKYWQTEYKGIDGIEKKYDSVLSGVNGRRIVEVDALGNTTDIHTTNNPEEGGAVTLTIDAELQDVLYTAIEKAVEEGGFKAGAGVLLDVNTGEVLALVSVPSFQLSLLNTEDGNEALRNAEKDERKPFLNRAIAGLYPPGSTIKPFMALAALAENIISPNKSIESKGFIVVKNRFGGPDTVFRDWKIHGYTDMRQAIAVSSDVYFYAIGGGYGDQKGLGIDRINAYMNKFGFATSTGIDIAGESTGIAPSQEWKQRIFKEAWRLGNTYHTSIGQYGFQVTPLQLAQSVASIANGGTLVVPHIVQNIRPDTGKKERAYFVNKEHMKIVQEGMRLTVTDGSAPGLKNVGFTVAAKTGTAEIGIRKGRVHSWMSGYFPYENPKYSFVIVLENGPVNTSHGAGKVSYTTLRWIAENRPYYASKAQGASISTSTNVIFEEEGLTDTNQ